MSSDRREFFERAALAAGLGVGVFPAAAQAPSVAMPTDRVAALPMWAGTGVDAIRDIPSAADLVPRLWRECLAAT